MGLVRGASAAIEWPSRTVRAPCGAPACPRFGTWTADGAGGIAPSSSGPWAGALGADVSDEFAEGDVVGEQLPRCRRLWRRRQQNIRGCGVLAASDRNIGAG